MINKRKAFDLSLNKKAIVIAALDALCQTFSPEQNTLFLTYEAARNAVASLSEDDFARAAFLLAREVYR